MAEQHERDGDGPDVDARRVARLLASMATPIHGASSWEQKVDFVLNEARTLTRATAAGFVRLDAAGRAPVLEGDLAAGLDDPATSGAVVDALLHGGTRVVGDEYTVAAVPRHRGRPHGALVLRATAPSVEAVLLLEGLAAHLGAAFDNLQQVAELEELRSTQSETVHQLQEAVRPPMPVVAETELGVHYLPADPQAPTGGDLYDWQALPDGDLHVVVVDVMGKGVAATKDALTITHVVRLLTLEGCPLERIAARADALLTAQHPDLVATMLVGRYTPATGVLRLAGAGHPPVLVVSDDGAVREVHAPGIALGWPGAGSFEIVATTLGRHDTAIFYTDGLIEATKDIEEGLDRLRAAAAQTARYPGQSLARALVERALAQSTRADDSLALVLRRRNPPEPDGATSAMGPFEYRFSPTMANVPLVRHFLEDWLRAQMIETPDRDDLLLIASELVSNAVKVASGRDGALALRARADGDAVVVEVEDDAGALQWPPVARSHDGLPDVDAERGRGLFLVTSLADQVDADVGDGRTVVRAVKRAVVPVPGSGRP